MSRIDWGLRSRQILTRQVESRTLSRRVARDANNYVWSKIGSIAHGKWLPIDLLDNDMTVISGGIGLDVTFDYELEYEWGANVIAFDPTPSVLTALSVGAIDPVPERWLVVPCALANRDGTIELFPQVNPRYTDWSTLDIDEVGNGIVVKAVSLPSFLRQNGISNVDILKLDIEGAAPDVLFDTLANGYRPRIVCIEIEPLTWPERTDYRQIVSDLRDHGYLLGSLDRFEFTFVLR